jgi:hypothetical protein
VGDRGRELAHGCDTIRVCEFRLHLAIALLALPDFFLRLLALAQVEHESDALVPAFFKALATPTSTGTRLPSFRKYSFSNGCKWPVCLTSGSHCRKVHQAVGTHFRTSPSNLNSHSKMRLPENLKLMQSCCIRTSGTDGSPAFQHGGAMRRVPSALDSLFRNDAGVLDALVPKRDIDLVRGEIGAMIATNTPSAIRSRHLRRIRPTERACLTVVGWAKPAGLWNDHPLRASCSHPRSLHESLRHQLLTKTEELTLLATLIFVYDFRQLARQLHRLSQM